jgi:cytochrome b6-f complex iron-sulfur subunit
MENLTIQKKSISREDFMKQVGIGFGAIILTQCVTSCTSDKIPDPITNTNVFKAVLKLTDAGNVNLNKAGGFVVFTSEARKIIAAQTKDGNFLAVAASCTHQNTELVYDSASGLFTCPLHGSQFAGTGALSKGPATSALKRYATSYDKTANTLTISEIV